MTTSHKSMLIVLISLAALLCGWFIFYEVLSQFHEIAWKSYDSQANKAYFTSNYEDFEIFTQASLLEARKYPAHPQLEISSLMNLALVYCWTNRAKDGVPLLQRALRLSKHHGHKTDSQTASIYQDMGILYMTLKQYDAAEKNFACALPIILRTNGENSIYRALHYMNSGLLRTKERKYTDAIQQYQHAIDIFKQQEDISYTAAATCYLADNYIEQANYPQALKLYCEAMVLLETNHRTNNPQWLEVNESMAKYFLKTHQYTAASERYQQVILQAKQIINLHNSYHLQLQVGLARVRLAQQQGTEARLICHNVLQKISHMPAKKQEQMQDIVNECNEVMDSISKKG